MTMEPPKNVTILVGLVLREAGALAIRLPVSPGEAPNKGPAEGKRGS